MAHPIAGVNPQVLKWAREKSGYSIDQVAAILKKSLESLEAWETGDESPTYAQLEKIAYQIYKRPIALFFFPEPPEEIEPTKSFRTLPEEELRALGPDTRLAVRQAKAMQLILYELNRDKNPASRKIFHDLSLNRREDVRQSVVKVRDYLSFSLDKQISFKDTRQVLGAYRDSIQECGLFVFKRSFKQGTISGFSLSDSEFPVIYLNNSTTITRQLFSIIHELAHVLLNSNGIRKEDFTDLRMVSQKYQHIEIFCNRFAAEMLVPLAEFKKNRDGDFTDSSFVNELADHYNVSREVILRRALDLGLVSSAFYGNKAAQWNKQAIRPRRTEGKGNYYATEATYLGSHFLNLAFRRYHQGICTREQLAEYLNVKVKNLHNLEPYAMRFGAKQ